MKNLIAAVDLGSNSFRLVIGRVVHNEGSSQVYQIDRLKETVRLAAGLQDDKTLDDETIERAVNVLKRFGERLRSFSPDRVRAVATNTFRVASNAEAVLERAEEALGFPIEVIAGREEARLIFSGVTHSLPMSDDRRLVIDIGGGSTEFIIGQHFEPALLASLPMGCVSYSQRFFPGGRIDAKSMKAAELAARGELEAIAVRYRETGWEAAFGSSGTAKALCAILTASGVSQRQITLDGMLALKAKLIKVGSVEKADLPDIKPDRIAVLPGGLAIMLAAFQELGITTMQTGDGALRVGVMFDLLGRDAPNDMRAVTVKQFQHRYLVDRAHAERVKELAHTLYEAWADEDSPSDLHSMLAWAADLHEVGLSIAHHRYAEHSAYILANSDMPGFSNQEQELLAQLVLGHQSKLTKLYPPPESHAIWKAILCLRLASTFLRRRVPLTHFPARIEGKNGTLALHLEAGWTDANPLTLHTLSVETSEWQKVGFTLQIIE